MKIRPAGVIEEQGKVLFLRYAYPQGDVYGIPGGGVEEGESLRHALVREMEEELGIAVRVEDLLLSAEARPVGPLEHTLHLFFRCRRLGEGTPTVRREHTSAAGHEWLRLEDLPEKTLYPNVGTLLARALLRPGVLYVEELPSREWR